MSKYRTRRQQKRDRTLRKIRKIVLFAALLSLAGVLAYFYIMKKNKTEVQKAVLPEEKGKADTSQKIPKPSPKINASAAVPAFENPVVDSIKAPSNVAKEKEKKASVSADTATPTIEEETLKKELSRDKMMQIIEEISLKKSQMNNVSNCVTIRKTNTSNVENVFDIAPLLRNKGFVISGRQTINEKLEGIAIDASGSCITLTIGTLQ